MSTASYFLLWLEKKKPIKITLTTFPSISGFVQLIQWFRQCAPDAFSGAPSRTLTSQLLWEVGTFKIQHRNKPQTVKEDAAWAYFHPPVLLHISSKAWMSSIFTGWKYYHQDSRMEPTMGLHLYWKTKPKMQKHTKPQINIALQYGQEKKQHMICRLPGKLSEMDKQHMSHVALSFKSYLVFLVYIFSLI